MLIPDSDVWVAGEETLEEHLTRRGVSRRSFLGFCTAMATVIAAGGASTGDAKAATITPELIATKLGSLRKPVLVWLQLQECTGCMESVLRSGDTTVEELVLNLVSMDYNELVMAAAGDAATKNLDMAMHLACGLEGSTPAESDARVTHLATMKTEKAPKRFDICDDITSGFHAGQCAAHEAKITGLKRDAEMARLMSGWTPAERAAFVPLQAAQKAFTELRSGKEQDMTGTMRGVFYTDEMAIQADDFLLMIRQLSSARAPRYAAAQARDADADLNKAYQKALAAAPKTDDGGNVTQDNIRKTQRAWLAYRDAWIAFAKTKFPDYAPDSVNAWLTKKRSAMLRHLEF